MANESMAPAAGAGTPGSGPEPEPRALPAGRGASWWTEGWRLFTPSVGIWILLVVILAAVDIGLSLVPVVGLLASQILFPVFAGGLMLGCRAVDRGNPLTLAHLFAGFSQRTGALILVGVIYTALLIAVVIVVLVLLFLFFGADVIRAIAAAGEPGRLGLALGSMSLATLVVALLILALWVPVMMAAWFAPALVMLGGVEPLTAMKLSFSGCLKNIVAFLLYGLIGVLLAIAAWIPLGILGWFAFGLLDSGSILGFMAGIAATVVLVSPLFVLWAITTSTIYASYCDIFEDKDT